MSAVSDQTQIDLEANKALVRTFVEAWNKPDLDLFDTLMSEDAVLHMGGLELPSDPRGTRSNVEEYRTAFPDWRFDLRMLVAEGDYVAAYMPYSGTHLDTFAGVDPTHRRCVVDDLMIFRIVDNKIVEAWEVFDEAGMWRQLKDGSPSAGTA